MSQLIKTGVMFKKGMFDLIVGCNSGYLQQLTPVYFFDS